MFSQISGSATAGIHKDVCRVKNAIWACRLGVGNGVGLDKLSKYSHAKEDGPNGMIIERGNSYITHMFSLFAITTNDDLQY
jgi:hypothetical protein